MKTIRQHLLISAMAFLLVSSTAAAAQNRGDSKFAKLDHDRIHYLNYGKGPEALVLVHGWTQSVDAWRENIADLAKRNRVIVIDLPGHGQSDKPKVTYSMDYFARAIEAVLNDAKVKHAVLVGHSMGTPVARQFYRKYPAKTLAIVIVDGSLRPFGNTAAVDQMMNGFRGPKYQDAVNQMMAFIAGPNLTTELKQRINAASMNTPQYVLVSAFEGMLDNSIWGEDKIEVPVLAIMAKTPLLPPNAEESFRQIAPKIELQVWDGVGHFLMMEKPKEFDAAVIAWIDQNKLLKQ